MNRYQLARDPVTCALPTISGSTVHFDSPTASCARVATTLTYKISATGAASALLSATQAGAPVALRMTAPGHWLLDADPTKGDVVLTR